MDVPRWPSPPTFEKKVMPGGVGGGRRDAEHECSDVGPEWNNGQPEDETAEGHSSCGDGHQASGPDPIRETPSGEICCQAANAHVVVNIPSWKVYIDRSRPNSGRSVVRKKAIAGQGEDCRLHTSPDSL